MIEWQSNRSKPWLRLLAGLTLFFFFATNIGLADISSLANAQPLDMSSHAAALEQAASHSASAQFLIPENLGQIKRSFQGKRQKTIIHIQDAHANEEAQYNIARIVEYFAAEQGLKWVGVEGAEGELYTQLLSFFPDQEVRRSVSDYYLKQARMGGAEYAAIVNRPDLKLFGVEKNDLYERNRKAYLSAIGAQSEDEEVLASLGQRLQGLSRFVFSDAMRALIKQRTQFNEGGADLSGYVGLLVRMAKEQNMSLYEYPHMHSLLALIDLEGEIDFAEADKEIDGLINDLKKTISHDRLSRFLTNTIQFRIKKLKRADYYGFLEEEIQEAETKNGAEQLDEKYSHVLNYLKYIRIYDSIGLDIFDEINRLESVLKNKLFRTEEEVEMDRVLKIFEIYQHLFDFTLTKQDADFFFSYRSDFNSATFSRFLAPLLTKYHFSDGLPSDLEILDRDLKRIERFYEMAVKRDQILVQNAVQKMDEEGASISVLITGGFHTPGIEAYLREQDYSYVVIAPRIAKTMDHDKEESLYKDAMGLKPIPIQKKLIEAFRPPVSGVLKDPRFQLAARPLSPQVSQSRGLRFLSSARGGGLFRAAFILSVALSLLKDPKHAGNAMAANIPTTMPEDDQQVLRSELNRIDSTSLAMDGAVEHTRYLFVPRNRVSDPNRVYAFALGSENNLATMRSELRLNLNPAAQIPLGKSGVAFLTEADAGTLQFPDLPARLARKGATYEAEQPVQTVRSEVRKPKKKQGLGDPVSRRDVLKAGAFTAAALALSGGAQAQEKAPLAQGTGFVPKETALQLKGQLFGPYREQLRESNKLPGKTVRLGDFSDGIFGKGPHAYRGTYSQGSVNDSGPVAPYATALTGQVIPQDGLTALEALADSRKYPGAHTEAGFVSAVNLEQPDQPSERMLADDKFFTIAALANSALPARGGAGYLQYLYQSVPGYGASIRMAQEMLRSDSGAYKDLPDPAFFEEHGRVSYERDLSLEDRKAMMALMKSEWNYFRTLTAPLEQGGNYRIPANFADHALSAEADYFGVTGSIGGYLRALLAMEKMGVENGGISSEEAAKRVQDLVLEIQKLPRHKGFFFHSYQYTGQDAKPYVPVKKDGKKEVPVLDNKWVESGLRIVLAAAKDRSVKFNLDKQTLAAIQDLLKPMDFVKVFYDSQEHAFRGGVEIGDTGVATPLIWHYKSLTSEFRHHLISELGNLSAAEGRRALDAALQNTQVKTKLVRLELSDYRIANTLDAFLETSDAEKSFEAFVSRLQIPALKVSNQDKKYWLTYLAQKGLEGDAHSAELIAIFRKLLKDREGLSFEEVTVAEKDKVVLKETFFKEDVAVMSGVHAKDDALEQFGSLVDLDEVTIFPETLGRAAKVTAYAQKIIVGHREIFKSDVTAPTTLDSVDAYYNTERRYLETQPDNRVPKTKDPQEEAWQKMLAEKSSDEDKGLQGEREFILKAFAQFILTNNELLVRKVSGGLLQFSEPSDLLHLANAGGMLDQYFDRMQVIPEDMLDAELRTQVTGITAQNVDEASRKVDQGVMAQVEKFLRDEGITLTDENRAFEIYRAKLRLFWKVAFKGQVTNYYSFFANIMDENKGGQRFQKMWNRVFGRFETLARELFIFPETQITRLRDVHEDLRYRLTILNGLHRIHAREIARLKSQGLNPGKLTDFMEWINKRSDKAAELYKIQEGLYQIQGRYNDANNVATRLYPAAYDAATNRVKYANPDDEAKAIQVRNKEFSFINMEGYVASLSRDFRAASFAAAPLEQERNRVELADVINQLNSTFDIQQLSDHGVIRYATDGPEYQRTIDRDMAGFLLMAERSLTKAGKTIDQGVLREWVNQYENYVRARKLAESSDAAEQAEGERQLSTYFQNHAGLYDELYSVYGAAPANVRNTRQPTAVSEDEIAFLAEYKRDDLFQYRTMTWEANIMARGLRKNVAFRYLLETFYAEYVSPLQDGLVLKGSSSIDPDNILAKLDRMSTLALDQTVDFFSPAEQELIS